mmetsp:Transcript_95011/g.273495  ORF Transcript_95011/g.273495 Transcript_95011/m.273495 type:complete len:223 (-) Transcript_95011:27-695(-)
MKFWSTKRFAIFGSTSFDTTKRKKNSYTIWRWGQARSRDGSSSSGSEKANGSLFLVCKALKMFAPTMLTTSCINASLKQLRVLFTYSTISNNVCLFASFSRWFESLWKSNTVEQTSILRRKSSARSPGGASRSLGRAGNTPSDVGFAPAVALAPPADEAALPFGIGASRAPPLGVALLFSSEPMRRLTVWMSFMSGLYRRAPESFSRTHHAEAARAEAYAPR